MLQTTNKLLCQMLSKESMCDIDAWIVKYPEHERQSAVMAALRIAQEEKQYLTPELMDAIADYLGMPAIAVYEVASFYTMYELRPRGLHIINVCTNISCQLNGSADILASLESQLGIQVGQTTPDGQFTLRSVECLGACVNAPVLQLDKDYHEKLNVDKLPEILEQYKH